MTKFRSDSSGSSTRYSWNKTQWQFVVVLTIVTGINWIAASQNTPAHSTGQPAQMHWSAFTESMNKMHALISTIRPSGDPDADFVLLMLPHHQAALDMAKAELQYGHDPQVRRLAQEIVVDQQSEIELMRLWLKQHTSDASNERKNPAPSAAKEQ